MKLNFRNKILVSFSVIILLVMTVCVYGTITINRGIAQIHSFSDEVETSVNVLTELKELIKDSKNYATNWVYIKSNQNSKEQLRQIHNETFPELEERLKENFEEDATDSVNVLLQQQLTAFRKIIDLQKEIMSSLPDMESYEDILAVLEAEDLIGGNIVPGTNRVVDNLERIITAKKDLAESIREDAVNRFESLESAMIALMILSLLISFLMVSYIVKSINKTLGADPAQVNEMTNEVARGNLDVDTGSTGAGLHGSLLAMVRKLRKIVSEVISASDTITQASHQMSASARQISMGSSQQAANSEEVTSSMEDMIENIEDNARSALETEELSDDVLEYVESAHQVITQTISSMNQVVGKISVIRDISRQTNILSLNAQVEAARAGEAGKGFSVIASEVRKLAERSQNSANDIDGLSKSGIDVANQAGEMFTNLKSKIEDSARLIKKISTASEDQKSRASQVNAAIQELNNIIQQNVASSEEMSASSDELAGQADQMRKTIGFFKLK